MLSEVEASPRHGRLYVILSETKDLKACTTVHRHGDLEILHCVQNDKESAQNDRVLGAGLLLADERADVLNKHAHGNRVETTLGDNHICMLL